MTHILKELTLSTYQSLSAAKALVKAVVREASNTSSTMPAAKSERTVQIGTSMKGTTVPPAGNKGHPWNKN